MIQVEKRNGDIIDFDAAKIKVAIIKANNDLEYGETPEMSEIDIEYMTCKVVEQISGIDEECQYCVNVEEIQDIVEHTLSKIFPRTAKKYILYREHHRLQRDAIENLMKLNKDLLFTDSEEMDLKRDNANINTDAPMGVMLKMGTENSKMYLNNYVLPEKFREMHKKHIVHLHDADFSLITFNCLYLDVGKLLKKGFNTGHGFIRSPKSIRAAASLACVAIQSSQNDCFGGQALVGFDFAMAEYVDMSFRKHYKKIFEYTSDLVSTFKYRSDFDNVHYTEGKARTELLSVMFQDGVARSIYLQACKAVEDETMQGMEALVHNFNSLHCLPGSERIWVYDTKDNNLALMSMEEIMSCFERNRFQVISINKNNGKAEFKYINSINKKDNNRNLVTIKSKNGQKVTITDNHRMMMLNDNGDITEALPLEDKYNAVLSPRKIEIFNHTNNIYNLSKYAKRKCSYKNNKCEINSLTMNEKLAELLGYYVADGSVKTKDDSIITFTVCDKVEEGYMNNLVKEIFGKEISCNKTFYTNSNGETKNKAYLYSIGVQAVRAIKEICGFGSNAKRVPSDILLGNESIIKAFLNAYLSCDGKRDNFNSYSTINKTLRSQINFLIFRLGELPVYHEKRPSVNNPFNSSSIFYEGSLGGAPSKRIGLNIYGNVKFEIPRYTLSSSTLRLRNKKIAWGKTNDGNIPRRKYNEIRYDELEKICEFHDCKNDFERALNTFSINIIKKEEHNSLNEYVYDIEVEDNETFLTEDCIYVHNSRAGSQVPFSSINTGICTSPEGRLVNRCLLQAMWNGLGNGETPIFPILVFLLKSGVNLNPEDPNYDLFQYACKVSSKRLFPKLNWGLIA